MSAARIGEGFFYVPGTESCLRIGGRLRADYLYLEPFTRAQDTIGFRARGRLNIDHRTMTAYGQLRTYIRYEIDRNSGVFTAPGEISTNPKLQQGFIQFGGLTAGRVTSFFTDPNLPVPNFGDLRFDDPSNADVTLLAYTYSFGNGFSATLSLEDGLERRVNNELVFPLFGVGAASPVFAPLPFTYGGQRMPDIVANLRYTGTWGGAQLSGALHQIRDVAAGLTTVDGVTVPVLNPITGLPNPTFADTDYGFAVALNGYANLPFLGTGDTAWVSATYTDGAVGYINAGQAGPIGPPAAATASSAPDRSGCPSRTPSSIRSRATSRPTRLTASPAASTTTGPRTGRRTSSGRGCASTLRRAHGSWCRRMRRPSPPARPARSTGLVDFNEYRIGTNTIWTPVTGLQLGVEVLYTRVDPRGRVAVPLTNAAGEPTGFFKPTGSEDIWEGRLRIQRDF